LYRTDDPEVRERFKQGIIQAAKAKEIELIPDYNNGPDLFKDVICQGCVQITLPVPEFGCKRRKRDIQDIRQHSRPLGWGEESY
jgi:hypothetical protein